MKIEEIRGKGDTELGSILAGSKRELFDLRFKSASQSLTEPSRIRALRRSIARMSTVIRQRELGQEPKKQPQKKAKSRAKSSR
jgi:large subunit ribosomal protein L29